MPNRQTRRQGSRQGLYWKFCPGPWYLRALGCVQTWCPITVPENDSWWSLMWTHHFFKYPRQNSGTVPVPEFGHWTGQWYIGYPVSEHSTILCRCPGTSARAPSVNTALLSRADSLDSEVDLASVVIISRIIQLDKEAEELIKNELNRSGRLQGGIMPTRIWLISLMDILTWVSFPLAQVDETMDLSQKQHSSLSSPIVQATFLSRLTFW